MKNSNERCVADRKLFDSVLRFYSNFREYQPLTASNPVPLSVRKTLCGDALLYLIDTEAATKRALKNDPALLAFWCAIVDDVPGRVAAIERRVVARCAIEYRRCGLSPRLYFKRTFQAKKLPQVAEAQRAAA